MGANASAEEKFKAILPTSAYGLPALFDVPYFFTKSGLSLTTGARATCEVGVNVDCIAGMACWPMEVADSG
jgi:hypothetical protein